ncbi:TetR/AcrR family transcriptional regulator [soil metagenome]
MAVLHAVDDLLVEVGYAEMTMKGIAERAGVGRQTVYRWWSTKAEILFEASVYDAAQELTVAKAEDALSTLTAYLEALVHFLAHSPAGIAYRALLGEAQHDPAVAELLSTKDVLGDSARAILRLSMGLDAPASSTDDITALLIGPTFFWVLTGRDPARLAPDKQAENFLRQLDELKST